MGAEGWWLSDPGFVPRRFSGRPSKSHSRTGAKRHKAHRRAEKRAGWPDGRRAFGSVSGAIVQVLTRAEGELVVKAIHAEIECLLGGPVSRHSVTDYLIKRSKG